MGFLHRFCKLRRGYFARQRNWKSKQAGRALWQELDNRPRNAQVWAWRLRQYDGNDGGGARLIEVETDSPLFVALWKKIMPANFEFGKRKKKEIREEQRF